MDAFRLDKVTLFKNGKLILERVDWHIEEAEISTILGPTGSGKTSLLRLLNRLDDATSGEVLYQNKPMSSWNVRCLRKEVCMVLQTPQLFEGTVEHNLVYGSQIHGISVDVSELMSVVGLKPQLLNQDVRTLSVGQSQKVSIARVVAIGPRVLLLDEPTSALDPASTLQIESLVRELVQSLNLTCVFVTHDVEQAKRVADHGMVLIDGKKIEEGPIAHVLAKPRDPRTMKFVRGELK